MTAAVDAWFGASELAFRILKRLHGLDESWSFSIASPDNVPVDSDPGNLRDEAGAAAFMLRRIQALRYILRDQQPLSQHAAGLCLGYASDLSIYLAPIVNKGEEEGEEVTATAASYDSIQPLAEFQTLTVQLLGELTPIALGQ